MGAESTTPPAPADDKSQNPGGIFHSLKKKKKFYDLCSRFLMGFSLFLN